LNFHLANIVIVDNQGDLQDVNVESDSSSTDGVIIKRSFAKETLNKVCDLFNISPIKDA
jgi:hypothetical protein